MEKDCVAPLNSTFYNFTLKNATHDELFSNKSSHQKSRKLTVETNQTRFLDTTFNVNPDGSVTTKVFQKPGKFPAFWNFQIPKRYKRNYINDALH